MERARADTPRSAVGIALRIMVEAPLLLGAIEAGGTKFLCGIADRNGSVLAEARISTTTPDETLEAASAFFAMPAFQGI